MVDNVLIPRYFPLSGDSIFDMPVGHWASNNGKNVFVRCNETKHLIMTIKHEITKDGLLKPSLGCRGDHPNGMEHFHIWATLEGWDFEAKPEGFT